MATNDLHQTDRRPVHRPARPGRPTSRSRRVHHLGHTDLTELVERARTGDEEAWNEIFERFSPMVRQVVIGVVGISRALADDAIQMTWTKLARSIHSIREPERLPGWLKVTAKNEAVSAIRSEWRIICADTLDEIRTPSEDDRDELVASDESAAVMRALGTLNAKQRQMVELRYLGDEPTSYAEIADRMAVSQGAIGPTLGRALERMGAHPDIAAVR